MASAAWRYNSPGLLEARLISTVGADDKIEKAEAIGAEMVINHAREDVAQCVHTFTGGRGVDVVIEHIGQAVWDQCLRSLARGGRLVTCGATSGPENLLDARYVYSRQLTIRGSYMGTRAELLEASRFIEAGNVRPVVDSVFRCPKPARHRNGCSRVRCSEKSSWCPKPANADRKACPYRPLTPALSLFPASCGKSGRGSTENFLSLDGRG